MFIIIIYFFRKVKIKYPACISFPEWDSRRGQQELAGGERRVTRGGCLRHWRSWKKSSQTVEEFHKKLSERFQKMLGKLLCPMGGQRVQLRVAKERGLEEMLLKMEEQEKIKEKQDNKNKKVWRSLKWKLWQRRARRHLPHLFNLFSASKLSKQSKLLSSNEFMWNISNFSVSTFYFTIWSQLWWRSGPRLERERPWTSSQSMFAFRVDLGPCPSYPNAPPSLFLYPIHRLI